MTRFEELTDIINRNKNKSLKFQTSEDDLEVSGLGESGSNPLIMTADRLTEDGELDQTDPDLIDQLNYMNPRNRIQRGLTDSWDSNY